MAKLTVVLKISLVSVLLMQFVRLVCIAGSYYVIYTSLFVEGDEAPMFDGNSNFTLPEEESTPLKNSEIFGMTVPLLETTMSIFFIFLIVRFSKVGVNLWLKWTVLTRIFWMRFLWDVTAMVYAIMYMDYRRYKETVGDDNLTKTEKIAVGLIPVEYVFLGILEVVSRIFTGERIEQLTHEINAHIGGIWGKIFRVTYSIALVAYALRNFGVSLYFGMYSVILAETDKEHKVKILMLVLQIYLAVMRGKFFQFFLRLFLLPLTKEEDSEDFKFPKTFIGKGKKGDEEDERLHDDIDV